jgi:HlyD family secretion protein
MKNRIKLGLMLTILCLALLGTSACSGGSQAEVSQQLVKVERGDLTVSVAGSGKIEASREASLTFGSAGKVDRILVKEGDEVKAGDVLARLDTSSLNLAHTQAQVALAQAELALTQAQLAQRTAELNLKNTRGSEDALKLALLNAQINQDIAEDSLSDAYKSYDWDNYDEVASRLNKAKAYYEFAQEGAQGATGDNAESWQLLLERARDSLAAAQADYDNFVAGYSTDKITLKKKQVTAAQMAVAQAQKNLDDLAESIAVQELQVASANQSVTQSQQSVALAQQSLADAQRQLDEATIVAPFDGVVAQVLAREGDNIPSPSMAPKTVIYMIDPDLMELVVQVDEIDIPRLALGQEAVIKVEALPDTTFKGTISAVYPVPEEVGGVVLYNVRLAIEVPENSGIKVGMSASANVMVGKRSNVLLVPSRAVQKDSQGGTTVKVMSDGQVQARPVTVGLDDGLRVEITSGLQEGETVVVESRVKSSTSGMSLF